MSNLILPVPEVETLVVSPQKMRALATMSDLLQELRLNFYCPRCQNIFGPGKDGVVGNNEPGASTLTVRCGCTVRRCDLS